VIGISQETAVASTSAYDPTCGSGSLLLKVASEAGKHITLEGQEKDVSTAGLARMNMILHDFATASILSGNTLAAPKFKDGANLRTYDYVVANPPFSDKTWSTGITPSNDAYERFGWGEPPAKQGDYAYLLHIVRSMKSTGKGACILPHGVLFRGNAEAVIRKRLVSSGYLKGIIGLPANLFYGTGIPACIVLLDKEGVAEREGIFMIDASKGFMKDGPKNRLRERDLHKIVDVYTHAETHHGYSRMVPFDEIEKNDGNLNLPRYIDTQAAEDIQDIGGHLQGGIPSRDIEALDEYWTHCPDLRAALFVDNRPGYHDLQVEATELKAAIHGHPQFAGFIAGLQEQFDEWRKTTAKALCTLEPGCLSKAVIHEHSESLLLLAESLPLIDPYAVYQHVMDYWAETMQDDCHAISVDGWVARTSRIVETDKKGKVKDKGWYCDLVPKPLVVARFFADERDSIDGQQAELATTVASRTELEEEHSAEDAVFGELEKINKAEVSARLKEIKGDAELKDDAAVLRQWLKLSSAETALKKDIKTAEAELDVLAYDRYPEFDEDDVKVLVVEDKWLASLSGSIQGELDRVSQTLTGRIRVLADRYADSVPALTDELAELAARVDGHLERMGFSWK